MTAFLAIVADTWRQSRQQGVFLLMILSLAIMVGFAIFSPDPMVPRLTVRTYAQNGVPQSTTLREEVGEPLGLAHADLDGDGNADVALLDDRGLHLWIGQGAGYAPGPTTTIAGARGLLAADLDGVPGAELVVFGAQGLQVAHLAGQALKTEAPIPGDVTDVAAGDLDRDGDLDLVSAGAAGQVLLNDGSGKLSPGDTIGPVDLVTLGDVDGDGDLDPIGARGREVLAWASQGAKLAAPTRLFECVTPPIDLEAGRVTRQPTCTILVARLERVDLFVRAGQSFTPVGSAPSSTPEVDRILVEDVDGDGLADVALFSRVSGRSRLWRSTGPDLPQFTILQDLSSEVRTATAVFLRGGRLSVVGVESQRGIDLPLYDPNARGASLFEGEDDNWRTLYAESIIYLKAKDEQGKEIDPYGALRRAQLASRELSSLDRHAQLLGLKGIKVLYTLSLLFFIAACSGYFPGLLTEGGIDLVLSRPISRAQIYLGKFCGGLILYTVVSTAAALALVLGIGLRFGSYPLSVLAMIPMQVFTAAVMFSILAAMGVFLRSTALPLLFGLAFYIVIDTMLGVLVASQVKDKIFGETPLGHSVELLGQILPSFDVLKFSGQAAVFGMNSLTLRPIAIASAWLFGFLGIGYLRFKTSDY